MTPSSPQAFPAEPRLQEIINEIQAARAGGAVPDPKDWVARHPEHADGLEAYFAWEASARAAQRPTLSLSATAEQRGSGPDGFTTMAFPGAIVGVTLAPGTGIGDYELLEEIARGGMGVVYKARHKGLNRIVALKMILAGQLATTEQVRRFYMEAEEGGNLDHPNIVPIYQVGEEKGQHYFTMKLIEGDRLSDHVPRLQRSPRAGAELMATVARAVHHAHERGVLHRDLKPGNILVDAHGQPHVTDFGLAKHMEATGTDTTQSGAIVGTPSYMAPEQAAARKHLTTAADIYSLGAIFYELLTGRPPFQAENVFDVLRQVLENEPSRPSTFNLAVNRDLETICLTCLAKEPQRRYPTALALAEDLEHFLAGEPIRARPIRFSERALKWVRRRPALAALLAVSVLTLVSLGLLGWWHNIELGAALDETQRERTKAEASAVEARKQRRAAVDNARKAETERRAAVASEREAKRQSDLVQATFQKRLEVVDDLLIRVDGRLANYEGLESMRMEFLQEFLKLSAGLLEERQSDPAARRKTAQLFFRVGDLWRDARQYLEADEAYIKALELQEKLVKDFAKDPDYQNALAITLAHRADLLTLQRRYRLAGEHYRRAIAVEDRLAAPKSVERPNYLDRAAYYDYRLAILLEETGKTANAAAGYRDALSRYEKLLAAYPSRAGTCQYLAMTASALAMLQSQKDPGEAVRLFARVLAADRQAARLVPASKAYRRLLRDSYMDLADFLKEHGLHEEMARMASDYRRDFPDDSNETFNAACYAANAIPLVQGSRKLPADERRALASSYGKNAVGLLNKAVKEGYTDRNHMDKDTDLDPLRERPDYRELLADLDRRFPVQPLAPARAYAALLQEAGGVQARYQYLRRRAATPSARKMALAKKPRFEDHAAKFLQFADIHRNSPFAVEALFWILDNSNPQDGQTVQAAVAGLREKTLQVLERDHFQKADLADVCQRFAEKPMPDVAQLLRKALEKHALQDVRGLAGYALALSLAKQAELAGPRSPTEAAKLTLKAERQLEQVAKEYGSIPSGKSTLGEAAQAKLYELRHLTIGRQAPEIEGHDFAGKKFKLSDYRGKVVVLDFWANWCGYCRQMYPQERKLIERLRNKPFALIGVNCDDDKAEVQREIEKEKLSWRSWWDGGSTGQRITKQWQVESFPTLYILDSKGVIRYKNLRGPKLDAAVEKLLKEAPPSG